MPLRNLIWLLVVSATSLLCYGEATRNKYATILSEAIDRITRSYVEPVSPRVLFEGGIRGMIGELDPYSGYISPDDIAQFRAEIQQEFGGIGIEVGIEQNHITILSPVPGTPAFRAGLKAGDIILAIDGTTLEQANLDDAVKLMRGEIGEPVELQILHLGDQEPKTYRIVRDEIRIESVRGAHRNDQGNWSFVLDEHPRYGYIRVTSFGDHTAQDLRQAIGSLDGRIDGLILDLRGNAGGLLSSAVELCDMFIPPGKVVVTTRARDSVVMEAYQSTSPPLVPASLPIVILVDRFSASAAEIFAACLQDYGRATIVGERTWGKGTVQNVFDIEGGKSAIRLTTQTYWRPSGENIHRHKDATPEEKWGVLPRGENLIELSTDEFEQLAELRRRREFNRTEDKPTAESETNDEVKADTETESETQSEDSLDDSATSDTPAAVQPAPEISDVDSDVDSDEANDADTEVDAGKTDDADGTDRAAEVVDRHLQRAIEVLDAAQQVTQPKAAA